MVICPDCTLDHLCAMHLEANYGCLGGTAARRGELWAESVARKVLPVMIPGRPHRAPTASLCERSTTSAAIIVWWNVSRASASGERLVRGLASDLNLALARIEVEMRGAHREDDGHAWRRFPASGVERPVVQTAAVAFRMSDKTLRHPVTEEWCGRVRAALDQRGGRGELARMCDELRIPRAVMSEVLAGEYETSPHVEAIHLYLGWPSPLAPTAVLDAGSAVVGYMRLAPADRVLLDTASDALRGVHGEQAKRAVVEVLRLCRSY